MTTVSPEQPRHKYNKNNPPTSAFQKQSVSERAEKYFRKHYTDNQGSDSAILSTYTKFSKEEISPGNVLGTGAFGIVWEVNVSRSNNRVDPYFVDRSPPVATNRQFQKQHGIRSSNHHHKQPSYAMKTLSKEKVKDSNLFCQGLVSLAVEACLLSQIEPHPHIIKLRGVADTNPFDGDFFIVIDRLYGTLDDRINQWKSQEQQPQSKVTAMWNVLLSQHRTGHQQHRIMLWEPRYQACHDLASALEHLHHHRIVHRDIKPQNIGYNVQGDLTLFDFGMSRELPSQQDQNGLYKMTRYCGSPRYMAPEVANRHPHYNEQCDVYSFAVLAWQILTLQKPYEGYHIEHMKAMVWQEPFGRPKLARLRNHGKFQSLIDKAWSHDWKERPTMREIRFTFQQGLLSLCNDHATRLSRSGNLGRNRRRLTCVLPVEKSGFCPVVLA